MGSSSSSGGHATEAGNVYTNERFFHTEDRGTLIVKSRKVMNSVVIHHYLAMEVNSLWRVFERLSDGTRFFATESIWGRLCITLGEFSVRDVWEAARTASCGKYYLNKNNCNHWTEGVLRKLGYNIKLHGVLCSCRL
jgi:hypothetical protein